MTNVGTLATAALALGVGLAGTSALAQDDDQDHQNHQDHDQGQHGQPQGQVQNLPNQGIGGGPAAGQQGAGQQGAGGATGAAPAPQGELPSTQAIASGGPNAIVPQYWIADASLFLANAWNTAEVLSRESNLNIQAPAVLANQASFLVDAIGRSLNSTQGLLANAAATNPTAVPAARRVLAQLTAAQAQAANLQRAAGQSMLGPTYSVTAQATAAHLRQAEQSMRQLAQQYDAQTFAIGLCPTGGGADGGAIGGGPSAGGGQQKGGK